LSQCDSDGLVIFVTLLGYGSARNISEWHRVSKRQTAGKSFKKKQVV
jgi:hypothetical protein